MNKLALTISGVPIGVGGTETLAQNAGNLGGTLLGKLAQVFLFVIIVTSFVFMVYGGIKWITSKGEEKNVEGARNMIINASIGLGIAFLSYFVLNILSAFLNINLLGS